MELPYPDPTLYAVPFFILSLVGETWLLARWKKAGRPVVGYALRDTIASLAMGLGSVFIVGAINFATFELATYLTRWRIADLGEGWLAWTVAFVGWDFSFYWHHRLEHENRLLWACHVNHHSSQHYNLSTALRQPWTPFPTILFYAPWALFGVRPWLIVVSGGLNLVYQYWIHTEVIRSMNKGFSFVFNTPSHHRVHHASNSQYLDKNYGGALILWDRLFGTFEPEDIPVVYGLMKNITSHNPFVIAFHEYAALARDVRDARGLRERLEILWHGPAWRAPSLTHTSASNATPRQTTKG